MQQPSEPDDSSSKNGVSRLVLWAAALMMCASLVIVFWNLQDASLDNANTGSRYATIESLVDYGTYSIDKSIYRGTVDKVKLGDHFYSSKPPLLPTFGAGVYWVYQTLTGRTIAQHEGEVVRLVGFCTGWLGHLVLLIYVYRLSQLLLRRELSLLVTIATASFAYLGPGYATTLNNHSAAATFSMGALYHMARASRDQGRKRHWMLAGLTSGLLPALDLPSAALTCGIAIRLFLKDRRMALLFFLPSLLPGLVTHFALTLISTGSIVPVYMRRDLYDYPGSYWNNEQGIDALREAKPIYLFNMLIGHHGLFSMTPILIFSVIGLFWSIRRKLETLGEAWVVTGVSALIFVFYLFKSYNYGGWCVGMRWLVPQMGMLLIFLGVWLDQVRIDKRVFSGVLLAFTISAFHAQDALSGPFQYSRWHNWLEGKPNRGRTGDKLNIPKKKKKTKKSSEEQK